MSLLVYLAGPQDDVSTEEARGWREELMDIAPSGVAFFSPAHAYGGVNPSSFSSVDACNRCVIAHSADAVIANLMGPGRGLGTIREIEFGFLSGKVVVVVTDDTRSLMLHNVTVVPDLDTALHQVLELVDTKRRTPPWPWSMIQQQSDDDDG